MVICIMLSLAIFLQIDFRLLAKWQDLLFDKMLMLHFQSQITFFCLLFFVVRNVIFGIVTVDDDSALFIFHLQFWHCQYFSCQISKFYGPTKYKCLKTEICFEAFFVKTFIIIFFLTFTFFLVKIFENVCMNVNPFLLNRTLLAFFYSL